MWISTHLNKKREKKGVDGWFQAKNGQKPLIWWKNEKREKLRENW
jgi:hypothetical protein